MSALRWLARLSPAQFALGAAIAIHLAMFGSLFAGYLDPVFKNADTQLQGLDFFSIYEGGHRAVEGASLYSGVVEPVTPHQTFYRYVPAFAYVFGAPMNVLPPWPAYWAWAAFYELLLVVNAYASWRIAGRGKWGLVTAAMWFSFTPFYVEQYLGQFSFLMGTAIFWVGIGFLSRAERVAMPPWLLSLITKSNTALLGPLFLRIGWWRSLFGAGAIAGANGLYFLWRPSDYEVFYDLNFSGRFDPVNRFFGYTAGEFGGPALIRNVFFTIDSEARSIPAFYTEVPFALVLAFSLAATFLVSNPDRLELFAIWGSVFFLGWTIWEHHYTMYLPVAVLLVALRPDLRPWALATFVFVALPTPYWLLNNVWNTGPLSELGELSGPQHVWPAWGVVIHHAIKPVPVLMMWAYLVQRQLGRGLGLPDPVAAWLRPRSPSRRAA